MFNVLFEFLFKYRPLVYEQGDLAFRASWAGALAVAAAVVAGVLTLRTYAQVRGNSQPLDRTVLTVVRLAALAVLVPPGAAPVHAPQTAADGVAEPAHVGEDASRGFPGGLARPRHRLPGALQGAHGVLDGAGHRLAGHLFVHGGAGLEG